MSTMRAKLTLLIALLLACLGAILTGLAYLQMRSTLTDQIQNEMAGISDGYSQTVQDWVAGKTQVIAALAPMGLGADPMSAMKQSREGAGFDLTYVGYADKRMLYSDGRPQKPDYDPTARPWYKAAEAAGKPGVSEPYIDFDTKKLVLTFYAPVREGSTLRGVAGGDIFIDSIVKTILAIKIHDTGYAFLVDKNGTVIAHPDQKLTLKPLTELDAELSAAKLADLAQSRALGDVSINGTPMFVHVSPVAGTEWYMGTVVEKANVLAPLNKLLYTLIGIAIVAFLIMLPVAWMLLVRQLRGLLRLQTAMREISQGEGDLTRRMEVQGKDEIAETARAFNSFIEQLQQMFIAVRREADSVIDGVEAVTGTVERVAEDSRQISDVSSANAATLEEITVSISHIADAAREADGMVRATGEVSAESAAEMNRIASEMTRTVDAVRGLASMLSTLDNRSQQITGITNVIKDIADQTNLLALNAAIEAARAGEMGRGFAVVADEVRKLAERTAQATVEITGMVNAIRDETRQAVDNMQTTVSSVDGGVEMTQSAVRRIAQIQESVEAVVAKMNEIALSTGEQHNATTAIAQSTERINSRIIDSDAAMQSAHGTLTSLSRTASSMRQLFARFHL
ncbi:MULTISPECIES: methyl-accepting chemotaxis protein [Gulbenkiania]|uniref:Methyl-accepting chemotaxis sensory transducer with Cache sensor n=1 Tax=Gulbenkiania indica TaxID=375574 RepID=A0A0K6GZL1_9NEIS|nr:MULTISPECIES: methyl-accepting chemotaxis protein [Gulbenkiania]CUA84016.1 methyl-accepting chemotaxis sensory transducer with Cache sensor [Gulbenkiania indica]